MAEILCPCYQRSHSSAFCVAVNQIRDVTIAHLHPLRLWCCDDPLNPPPDCGQSRLALRRGMLRRQWPYLYCCDESRWSRTQWPSRERHDSSARRGILRKGHMHQLVASRSRRRATLASWRISFRGHLLCQSSRVQSEINELQSFRILLLTSLAAIRRPRKQTLVFDACAM